MPAAAQDTNGERILSFLSEVEIRPDTSLMVRETIRARALGAQIKRGIYRDFPTRYQGPGGEEHVVPFDVVGVERDGRPEPWHTEGRDNGVRVYTGDQNVFLEDGEHTWVITYRTDRQLGFFEDHDELYWNATGNGWVFPIDEAEARVTLPADPGEGVRLTAYTGPQGSREGAFSASWDAAARTAAFRATRGLGANEGLTVVVMWPKGVVAEPSRARHLLWSLGDNRGAIVGALGLLAVLAYYVVTWSRVGRDPSRGVIVTLYDPPPGLSPAAVRYLKRMRFDQKAFAATLVQMAVKGHLEIEERAGAYTLRRSGPGAAPLAAEERAIAAKLFSGGESVALAQANHARVGGALQSLRTHLGTTLDKVYFRLNRGHLAGGVLLSAAVLAATLLAVPGPQAGASGFLSLWLLGWSIGVGVLGFQVARAWRVALSSPGRRVAGVGGALFLTLFALPFFAGEMVGIGALVSQGSPAYAGLLLGLAGVTVLFNHLLKAPTSSGRTLLDRIEGFERFIAATEADRINRLQGPERTPALYERLLAYAIALDLEERWSEQFADVLARAGEAPGTGRGRGYSPAWYHGDFGAGGWSPAAFAGSLGGSLSGAIASSSTPPGSRSGGGGGGGGGGGSSGGGGGGGGGGGW